MSLADLIDRLASMADPKRTDLSPPPAAAVAFAVRWERGLRNLKVNTLASFASVSVSTVERVERGEVVSADSLDRIAVAFGYEAGRFTTPRIPKTKAEATRSLLEDWGHFAPVAVRALNCQAAVRQLAQCHGILLHSPKVPEVFMDEIKELVEWIDLASMLLDDQFSDRTAVEGKKRKLYGDILTSASNLEREGLTILTGVILAPKEVIPDLKVAVISVSPKALDPGAPKRKHLLVDLRNLKLDFDSFLIDLDFEDPINA